MSAFWAGSVLAWPRFLVPALLVTLIPTGLAAQTRSLAQDSTLDNLQHPPGITAAAEGTLGRVRIVGQGPRTMLLVPGIGFGDGVWDGFVERHRTEYR